MDVIIVLYLQRFQIKDMQSIETEKCRVSWFVFTSEER